MKFWNFTKNETERILRLDGPIDSDNFWSDEITPKAFRDELESEDGDITVWINSPGGNVFAAAEIYTMLKNHKGKISVKIDALAASAASVVAMAGDKISISPTAMIMIHNPMTSAMGSAKDMEKVIDTLNEVKESIINAYEDKTHLPRNEIAQLMEDETWMNAHKAVELGFADEILFQEGGVDSGWNSYSAKATGKAILNRLISAAEPDVEPTDESEADRAQAPVLESESIGLNGKTANGSMPYELLVKQLEFLR